jgi:uncharacterized phage protein gp47/JayE
MILTELTTQVRQDLAAEGVSQVWIRRTFEAALAIVLGGMAWMFQEWVSALSRQGIPSAATGSYLDAWAQAFGLTRTPASTADGTAILSGTPTSIQPAGSILVGPDGQEYTTDNDCTIGEAGVASVAITASGTGEDYNLYALAPMTVSSPAAGINSDCTAGLTGVSGGDSTEADNDLRVRLLARIQRPAEVGNAEDYARWAREADPQVARVWVYNRGRDGSEAGTVLVLFGVDGQDPIP